MRGLFIAALLALACLSQLGFASSVGTSNIGAAINSTAQYIKSVNESAYLVFYPNLAQAYNALGQAENVSRDNSTAAYALLATARSDAQSELQRISQYKQDSLYVMLAVAAFLAAMLAWLMRRPTTKKKNVRRRARN